MELTPHIQPKVVTVDGTDLLIEIPHCPVSDLLNQSSTNFYCDITHGVLAGFMSLLGFKNVEKIQTIQENALTCLFHVSRDSK